MTVTVSATAPLPDFEAGVAYWANTEATVNGVLGGYGPATSVPRLDAASSRMLLLSLLPGLSTIIPPHLSAPSASSSSSSTTSKAPRRSYRALDCGAGIGRVTSTVLLPLFHRVDLVEPVAKFLKAAEGSATTKLEGGWKLLSNDASPSSSSSSTTKTTGGEVPPKGVRMWLAGLQHFNPRQPAIPVDPSASVHLTGTFGSSSIPFPSPSLETPPEDGYDIIMIQWCIGHLSDVQLVEFLKRSRGALREEEGECKGYIVLKENICLDEADGGKGTLWDSDDSSYTRSDKVFRRIFAEAGLELLRREVQMGFPKELFPVIAYVLR